MTPRLALAMLLGALALLAVGLLVIAVAPQLMPYYLPVVAVGLLVQIALWRDVG